LVIEVDGGQRFETSHARRDERRTVYLEGQSLRVLRFPDREVLQQLDAAVDAVFAAVSAASKSP
jgi:very-short-patch-repair endonuclease